MKLRRMALLGGITFTSCCAWGATLELVPKVGYQFNVARDLSGPIDTSMNFDNEPIVGLSLGYLTAENGELEVSWTHSNTTARIDQTQGAPAQHFDVGIDQIHFNGMYMLSSDAVQPFVLLGLGATRYSASGNRSDNTKFSIGVGGGAKWLWNDHLGLRFDALWTPTLAPAGTDFFCDKTTGVCNSTESNSMVSHWFPFVHSFQTTIGLLLRL